LRNSIKPALNVRLSQQHCIGLGQRYVVWRSRDVSDGGELSSLVKTTLNGEAEGIKNIPTWMVFFPGCRYFFSDPQHPEICWVTNFSCTGTKLLLDNREPKDDLTQPFRMLKYMPVGLCVRPEGTSLGNLSNDRLVPEHSILVRPMQMKKAVKVKFPAPIQIYKGKIECKDSVDVKRNGFNISIGNCVTDFYAQGMTFGPSDPFFIFLNLAKGDHMLKGASVRVAISRPTTLDDFHLPSPLYDSFNAPSKSEVRKKWIKALKPSHALVTELNRLDALALQTLTDHSDLWKKIDSMGYPPSSRATTFSSELRKNIKTFPTISTQFRKISIPPNGSCLFSACNQGENLATECDHDLPSSDWTPFQLFQNPALDIGAFNLRQSVVQHLTKEWENDNESAEAVLEDLRYSSDTASSGLAYLTNKEDYLLAMSMIKTWGGEDARMTDYLVVHLTPASQAMLKLAPSRGYSRGQSISGTRVQATSVEWP
jgi:hypothetical protein